MGQIVASLICIVLSLSWSELSDHVYNSNLGYDRKNVVFIPVPQDTLNNYKLFQAELKKNPEFYSIAASNGTPGMWSQTALVIPEGKSANEAVRSYLHAISTDFMKTMEMQLISGRGFSEEYNDENSYIINQLTAKRFGWDNPVGKTIQVGDKKGVIIGMVKDYYFSYITRPILPAILYLGQKNLTRIFIKHSGNNEIASIKEKVKGTWNKIYPDIPLEITSLESYFHDINLTNTYIPVRFTKILGGTAMFFSCIGLLAMISYSARKRKKEIAIRKVHGASITNIVTLLGREFVIIILLASLIGLPIGYLLTDQMFAMFPIRNSIGIGVLLVTLFIIVSISSLFIMKEIFKAAKQAPVETLKCE